MRKGKGKAGRHADSSLSSKPDGLSYEEKDEGGMVQKLGFKMSGAYRTLRQQARHTVVKQKKNIVEHMNAAQHSIEEKMHAIARLPEVILPHSPSRALPPEELKDLPPPATNEVDPSKPCEDLESLFRTHQLFFQIVRGKSLIGCHIDGLSHPYCKIYAAEELHRIRALNNTLNPFWNETVVLPGAVMREANYKLKIEVYSRDDLFLSDDFMGETRLDLRELSFKNLVALEKLDGTRLDLRALPFQNLVALEKLDGVLDLYVLSSSRTVESGEFGEIHIRVWARPEDKTKLSLTADTAVLWREVNVEKSTSASREDKTKLSLTAGIYLEALKDKELPAVLHSGMGTLYEEPCMAVIKVNIQDITGLIPLMEDAVFKAAWDSMTDMATAKPGFRKKMADVKRMGSIKARAVEAKGKLAGKLAVVNMSHVYEQGSDEVILPPSPPGNAIFSDRTPSDSDRSNSKGDGGDGGEEGMSDLEEEEEMSQETERSPHVNLRNQLLEVCAQPDWGTHIFQRRARFGGVGGGAAVMRNLPALVSPPPGRSDNEEDGGDGDDDGLSDLEEKEEMDKETEHSPHVYMDCVRPYGSSACTNFKSEEDGPSQGSAMIGQSFVFCLALLTAAQLTSPHLQFQSTGTPRFLLQCDCKAHPSHDNAQQVNTRGACPQLGGPRTPAPPASPGRLQSIGSVIAKLSISMINLIKSHQGADANNGLEVTKTACASL
eukprot:gene8915-3807_t